MIERAVRVPILGSVPGEECEVDHRGHENRSGCTMGRIAFNAYVRPLVQHFTTQPVLKMGLKRHLLKEMFWMNARDD